MVGDSSSLGTAKNIDSFLATSVKKRTDKNFKSELTDAKLNSVDKEIKVYYKDTIKPYINYVVDKYGKNFIDLY